jgi:glycosyltransferase involved in cell wall biosynthesis
MCRPIRAVEAGAGLSVPAEDPAAMADAIKKLLALYPEERAQMGLRGRRYVEAHHDMARLAERFEARLRSAVLGDPNAADPEPMAITPSES